MSLRQDRPDRLRAGWLWDIANQLLETICRGAKVLSFRSPDLCWINNHLHLPARFRQNYIDYLSHLN